MKKEEKPKEQLYDIYCQKCGYERKNVASPSPECPKCKATRFDGLMIIAHL